MNNRFDSLFVKYGEQFQVPWRWLKAICMVESSLGDDPLVQKGEISEDGKSWGVMQLTLMTARQFEKSANADYLNVPENSIKIAAQLLDWIMKRFPSDGRTMEWAIKSYNQGVGNTKREISGEIKGFANDYWSKFQKALSEIEKETA